MYMSKYKHVMSIVTFITSNCEASLPNLLRLPEQTPVLDLECLPDTCRVLDCGANQLALLAEFQIDVCFVVLAFDVWHVDSDEDVGLGLF